jgi:glyoxylase-like metal-dependent hydrolase (beta-lactamase superfamily II)
MLIRVHPAPMYATNCWILAAEKGSECIIVDPGMPDISAEIEMIVEEEGLKPVAVLLTHGHLDHTFSVIPLADGYGIPAYIHSEDRRALLHPESVHGEEFIASLSGVTWSEPSEVRELKNNQRFDAVGLNITAIHAPGHTAGSLMFTVNEEILISGDVLFAGSIGRTDLPSGSHEAMQRTLTTKILPLADHLRVLPGHGPDTTIEYERRTNPYLKQLRS